MLVTHLSPKDVVEQCGKSIYPQSCALKDRPLGLSGPIMCSWFLLPQGRECLIRP